MSKVCFNLFFSSPEHLDHILHCSCNPTPCQWIILFEWPIWPHPIYLNLMTPGAKVILVLGFVQLGRKNYQRKLLSLWSRMQRSEWFQTQVRVHSLLLRCPLIKACKPLDYLVSCIWHNILGFVWIQLGTHVPPECKATN